MSPEMEDIRDKVLSGEKIKACETCYKQEEVNPDGESYRQRKIAQNKHNLPTYVDKVNLKLRINGTYCNLSCCTQSLLLLRILNLENDCLIATVAVVSAKCMLLLNKASQTTSVL